MKNFIKTELDFAIPLALFAIAALIFLWDIIIHAPILAFAGFILLAGFYIKSRLSTP